MTVHSPFTVRLLYHHRPRLPKILLAAVAAAWLLAPGMALADVATGGNGGAVPTGGIKVGGGPDAGRVVGLAGDASLRCWQGGKEIAAETGYGRVVTGDTASARAIRLEQGKGDSGTLLAVPIDETFCLVKVKQP